jgi:uncharacterized protein
VDVLRGFAIFGILLVNMAYFKTPMLLQVTHVRWWPDPLNVAVTTLIRYFAEGKFVLIFSLLFGLGLALQMERAKARGVPLVPVYMRRLLVLLAIGWTHAFLVWFGDILAPYALIGFLLLLFRKCRPATLTVWTIVLLCVPLLLVGALTGLVWFGMQSPAAPEMEEQFALQAEQTRLMIDRAQEAYSGGSFLEVTRQRINDVLTYYSYVWVWGPGILAWFLVGLNLGRRRFFHRLDERVAFLRSAAFWFLVVGVVGNAIYAVGVARSNPLVPTATGWVAHLAGAIGIPAMSFFYVATIALLWQRGRWRRRLSRLAPVGRMALTNYLLQSAICTTIFYSHGLGLFGRVPASAGLLVTIAVFALQVPASAWWLRRFRFGPAEWVWRSLTYLEPQPFRRP